MKENIKLHITDPSGELPVIDFGRHFAVEGTISGDLPGDSRLTVTLLDSEKSAVRHVSRTLCDGFGLYLSHPALTKYPPEFDPDLSLLRNFGFPPLTVRDTKKPEESLRDATIKCHFDREKFKCIIVSATDTEHGLFLPDGMEYTDDKGNKYTALPRGNYTINVTLSGENGTIYATAEKGIVIGDRKDRIICRFNPREHKMRMAEWCKKRGFSVITDLLPGYLEAYTGKWLYHMGLLKMYRACDIAMYIYPKIHMFIYNITPDSTSYETEIGFLQTSGRLSSPEDFTAYCYDMGEAEIDGKPGKIVEFEADEYLKICRIDSVDEKARENILDLSYKNVKCHHTSDFTLSADERFAVMGVIKPWQMKKSDFTLRDDNTYEMKNRPETLEYTFICGGNEKKLFRTPGLERICGESIGNSVFEFYNIFEPETEYRQKTVTVKVSVLDSRGSKSPALSEFTIQFT